MSYRDPVRVEIVEGPLGWTAHYTEGRGAAIEGESTHSQDTPEEAIEELGERLMQKDDD